MADFDIRTLVTDRTQADVDALHSALLRIATGRGTGEDYALVNDPSNKGGYNYTDLNRVGTAVGYLRERLQNECGYSVDVAGKNDWQEPDIPTVGMMSQYLDDVSAIRAVLPIGDETPPVPNGMANFTYSSANDIETILTDVEQIINTLASGWVYSNEVFTGEV